MMRRIMELISKEEERGKADLLYPILNYAFHALHIGIILFTLFGWILHATRLAHLIFVLLTLFSWYVLGFWLGEGYCPITHWHWMIRRKIPAAPIPDSYIKLVLDRMTGRDINSARVNLLTLVVTLLSGGLSLALNIAA
jgi:hypothetical protein